MSVEPGCYKAGEFGMRIENLVQVVKDEHRSNDEMTFLKLEPLTLCPIDLSLVEASLLSEDEAAYLDAYHVEVRERLSPFLNSDEDAWLSRATGPITE